MTGVEVFLLLIGAVFMVGSFFITEKLSPSELSKIARLSEGELKKIIGRGLEDANSKIEDAIDEQIETSTEKTDRALEKVTNEKIMAISEYSDTVLENMNKVHNEIMFLYNMLNDKHTELTGMASDLQRLAADVRNMQENMTVSPVTAAVTAEPIVTQKVVATVQEIPEEPEMLLEESTDEEKENHNKEILALHKEGISDVEIARRFGLGLGEVKLVIGLYKGDIDS
ncbi:MAG: DUF6115 domain-containing protein [Clostridiales bacterium]|nr:DUF6115 domain-containing protein [Clostridiales bacterium]